MAAALVFLIKYKLLIPLLILMVLLLIPYMVATISSLYVMTSTLITESVGEVVALGEASATVETVAPEVSGVSVGNSTLLGTELTDPIVSGTDIVGSEQATMEEATVGTEEVGTEEIGREEVVNTEDMVDAEPVNF